MERGLEFKNEKEIKEYIKNLNFFEVTTLIEELMIEKYLKEKEEIEQPKITISLEEFMQHFYIRRPNQRGAIRDRYEYNRRISRAINDAMEDYKGSVIPRITNNKEDEIDAGDVIKKQDKQELFDEIKGKSPFDNE